MRVKSRNPPIKKALEGEVLTEAVCSGEVVEYSKRN